MGNSISVNKVSHIDHTNAYSVTVKDPAGIRTHTVWTGNDGKGLWIDGRQVEGRGQFSAGKNAAAAIRRYFTN